MIPRKGKPPCHALLSGEEISGLTMNPKIIRDDGIGKDDARDVPGETAPGLRNLLR